jgi:hypothetical protein
LPVGPARLQGRQSAFPVRPRGPDLGESPSEFPGAFLTEPAPKREYRR